MYKNTAERIYGWSSEVLQVGRPISAPEGLVGVISSEERVRLDIGTQPATQSKSPIPIFPNPSREQPQSITWKNIKENPRPDSPGSS